MSDFLSFCRAHGIVIDSLPPQGIWRRYKTEDKPLKRNGAVKWMGDHGFVQNHATMTDVEMWRDGSEAKAAPIDPAIAARRREQEREQRMAAIRSARDFWNKCHKPDDVHPYLRAKGLSAVGTTGIRFHLDKLVIPVMWNGRVISLQTITPEGVKRFWPGAPVKGGSFVMPRLRAPLTVICEGFATGLAVFQAVRQASVIVAFDAGNLLPVIEAVQPSGTVVIAADNDHGTQAKRGFNPGIEKATNAAELLGCGVAYPKDIEGTDYADALKEWGAPGARRIERDLLAGARYVTAKETS